MTTAGHKTEVEIRTELACQRAAMFAKISEAETLAYHYLLACPAGYLRERASAVYTNLRMAQRIG